MSDFCWLLVQATEAAALATVPHVGRGDKLAVDRAAADALRACLNRCDLQARIAIGEGEKDRAPGLFEGERLGRSSPVPERSPRLDLAVDPVDGTAQAACGGREALSVLAAGPRGGLLATRVFYMNKVAIGPRLAAGLDGLDLLELPPGRLIDLVARIKKAGPDKITVALLDRPRHARLVEELRETGCRIALRPCDVSSAVATAFPGSGIDICLGTGGAPEAVLSAAALKCLGGDFQGMLVDGQGKAVDGRALRRDDLVQGEAAFAATGITDGCLLRGVQDVPQGRETHSLLLTTGGLAQWITTVHQTDERQDNAAIPLALGS